jgi:hypothetical protein
MNGGHCQITPVRPGTGMRPRPSSLHGDMAALKRKTQGPQLANMIARLLVNFWRKRLKIIRFRYEISIFATGFTQMA